MGSNTQDGGIYKRWNRGTKLVTNLNNPNRTRRTYLWNRDSGWDRIKILMLETKRSESVGRTACKMPGKKECCVIHFVGRGGRESPQLPFSMPRRSGETTGPTKESALDLQTDTTIDFMTILEDIFVTTRILAFERKIQAAPFIIEKQV